MQHAVVNLRAMREYAGIVAFTYGNPEISMTRSRIIRARDTVLTSSVLTHFDKVGAAHMVDVGGKSETHRVARASGKIVMHRETLDLIQSGTAKKGDVLGIARIAAIQAAKRTSELVPLAHPITITRVVVDFRALKSKPAISMTVTVETYGRTGVEMEALTATAVGLLTVYDMCKSVDRSMTIENVQLVEKTGGKSGRFYRAGK